MKVKECMNTDVKYLNPNATIWECAKLMSENHIGCVPVCNTDNNVVGIITDRDVIMRVVACDKDYKNTKVTDIMTCNVCSCDLNFDVQEAQKLMSQNAIRRLPVTENNKIVGIISLGDLVQNNQVDNNATWNTFENICDAKTKNAE